MTSYNPQAKDVTLEETGAHTDTDKQLIYNIYTELLKDVDPKPGQNRTETYEDQAKKLFIEEPANMKLLVVVDKLLTGFDAPPSASTPSWPKSRPSASNTSSSTSWSTCWSPPTTPASSR